MLNILFLLTFHSSDGQDIYITFIWKSSHFVRYLPKEVCIKATFSIHKLGLIRISFASRFIFESYLSRDSPMNLLCCCAGSQPVSMLRLIDFAGKPFLVFLRPLYDSSLLLMDFQC